MSSSDALARVLAVLTLAYNERRIPQPDQRFGADATTLIGSLMDELFSTTVEVQSSALNKDDIQDVAYQVAQQLGARSQEAIGFLISIFCSFAEYAESTSPDIDVPGFLRAAGLDLATDRNQ